MPLEISLDILELKVGRQFLLELLISSNNFLLRKRKLTFAMYLGYTLLPCNEWHDLCTVRILIQNHENASGKSPTPGTVVDQGFHLLVSELLPCSPAKATSPLGGSQPVTEIGRDTKADRHGGSWTPESLA